MCPEGDIKLMLNVPRRGYRTHAKRAQKDRILYSCNKGHTNELRKRSMSKTSAALFDRKRFSGLERGVAKKVWGYSPSIQELL